MKDYNYNLDFISNDNLFNHVKETVSNYRFDIDLKKFNQNIIDPIKLTFDHIVYNKELKDTIENEVLRQLDKSNSNLIGYFHQNIFKYFSPDWQVPKNGYDIQNINSKIFVEIKNKHNTMNSSSSAKTYMRMLNTLLQDNKSTCLLVEVIAKKSQNKPWVITLDGVEQPVNQNIRRVSIDKFYEMVIGDPQAFSKLCLVLPQVIRDVVAEEGTRNKSNSVFYELENLSDDLLTSIYLLSFKRYEGFNNFRF